MNGPQFAVVEVIRYRALCQVEGCSWEQEHRNADSAARDGVCHVAEWHEPTEEESTPSIVNLMEALEASLAAVKAKRADA